MKVEWSLLLLLLSNTWFNWKKVPVLLVKIAAIATVGKAHPKNFAYITVTSNQRHSISKHRQIYCLCRRLFGRRSKKTSKLRVTGLLWGESIGNRWIPFTKGPVTRKTFHDVVMIGCGMLCFTVVRGRSFYPYPFRVLHCRLPGVKPFYGPLLTLRQKFSKIWIKAIAIFI